MRAISENDPRTEPFADFYDDLEINFQAKRRKYYQERALSLYIEAEQITIDKTTERLLLVTPIGANQLDTYFWSTVVDRLLGIVILVDSAAPSTWRHARALIQTLATYAPRPYLVVLNHQNSPDAWSPTDLHIALRLWPETQVVACDTLDKVSVTQVLLALLEKVKNDIET